MSVTPTTPIDEIRSLSSELFAEIKPHCVELSTLSLSPNFTESPSLVRTLALISSTLESHHEKNSSEGAPYIISKNLADYVFFPLTALLKQPKLEDKVIQHILKIIGFLTRHSWSSEVNVELIDQLFPLILVLSGDEGSLKQKSFEFRESVVYCLSTVVLAIPNSYFSAETESKRLQFLGKTVSIYLEVISSLTNPASQEQVSLIESTIQSLDLLIHERTTPERLSQVLPGIVSQIVAFVATSKNLHFSVHMLIFDLLSHLISKVFDDIDLGVTLRPSEFKISSLADVNSLWESGQLHAEENREKILLAPIDALSSSKHRTAAWLKATSKQLKISLNILFKELLVTSQSNKTKFITKPQLCKKLVNFIRELFEKCFVSLFNEVVPLSIDVLAALISCTTQDDLSFESSTLEEYSSLIIESVRSSASSRSHAEMLLDLMYTKIDDLIDTKITSVFYSVDEEKIHSFLVRMKLQLATIDKLSQLTFKTFRNSAEFNVKILNKFKSSIIDSYDINSGRTEVKKASFTSNAINSDESLNNKLDNIELPPTINAKQIRKIRAEKNYTKKKDYSSSMMVLSNKFDHINDIIVKNDGLGSACLLSRVYTAKVETKLTTFIEFLSSRSLKSDLTVDLLEKLFDGGSNQRFSIGNNSNDSGDTHFETGISLWIANHLLKPLNHSNSRVDDLDAYLNLDEADSDEDEIDSNYEEVNYMIMSKSQEQISEISELINSENYLANDIPRYEISYAIALDSIGVLSSCLPLKEFQADYLIDYLYILLESLTFQSNPLIQAHGQNAVKKIIENHYEGSLERLIMDNSDYLIDSMNIRLSVITDLTPTLPKLLLLVIKIAGMKLLERNELSDILTQIFLIIDSYHGYGMLVEGFFIVFEELIDQIEEHHLKEETPILTNLKVSDYKPWGIHNRDQLIRLIEDSDELIGETNYDPNKEYFVRKPGVPFAEQIEEADSDDEVEDSDGETTQSEEEKWISAVPKPIFLLVQRIFKYGFMMMTHESLSVRVQIIKTMKQAYPILCTDYGLTMPIVSENWPLLLASISGTSSLSDFQKFHTLESETQDLLILPALELVQLIIEKDEASNEKFMGRKFIESWEFLKTSPLLKEISRSIQSQGSTSESKEMVLSRTAIARSKLDPRVVTAYVKFLWTGLRAYSKIISDTARYNMVQFAIALGVPTDIETPKEVENIIWVIEHESRLSLY